MTPKISVVICAYNAGKVIHVVLDSLKKQTFKDFEVIVVNDGSNDNTKEIAASYGVKVKNMPRIGLSRARNTGINAANADIVAIIDADCHADENWLNEIYETIKVNKVVSGCTKIPKSTILGDSISALGYPGGAHLGFEKMWKVIDGYTDHLAGGNCAFIKKIVQDIGAFNPKLTITADDVFLSHKLIENDIKIKYNPNMIMTHPARYKLKDFITWHFNRGKGNYFFKKEIKNVNKYVHLKIWQTKNIIKYNLTNPRFPLIFILLFLSYIIQTIGFYKQKLFGGKLFC